MFRIERDESEGGLRYVSGGRKDRLRNGRGKFNNWRSVGEERDGGRSEKRDFNTWRRRKWRVGGRGKVRVSKMGGGKRTGAWRHRSHSINVFSKTVIRTFGQPFDPIPVSTNVWTSTEQCLSRCCRRYWQNNTVKGLWITDFFLILHWHTEIKCIPAYTDAGTGFRLYILLGFS